MKSLKGPPDNVVDVRAKLTVDAKRRLWAITLALSLSAAGAIWFGYFHLWKPYQYRQTAEFVMRDVLKDMFWEEGTLPEYVGRKSLFEMQPIDQSLYLACALAMAKIGTGGNNEMRIDLAHKLFQYSIFFGNPFARIDYGVSLREGKLGLPDKAKADYQFEQAKVDLYESASKGLPRQALAYSLLLSAGYGIPKDSEAANSLASQVISELNVDDLLRLKDSPGDRRNLKPEILNALISKGYVVHEQEIKSICILKFGDQKSSAMERYLDHIRDSSGIQNKYYLQFTEISSAEKKCIDDLINKSGGKDNDGTTDISELPAGYSGKSKQDESRLNGSRKPSGYTLFKGNLDNQDDQVKNISQSKSSKISEIKDRTPKFTPLTQSDRKTVKKQDLEKQSDTGYLNGSPPPIAAGLSTFTVDNKSGSSDAIARIYLNGDKPAVRQIYIKIGERFTAKDLAPGRYVLRYRFIGSSDTYEADKVFALEEIRDSQGITYSNVSVTLFTVTNGNMKVKRVPNEKF